MSSISEIDRQMAELEALASGKTDDALEPTQEPEEESGFPTWLKVAGVVVIVDLAARFFVPASDTFVLLLEGAAFAAGGIALLLPVLRKTEMSVVRRRIHSWLGGAFMLGAIRSGLWGAGLPVQYANLVIFVLGLAALGVWYVKSKRKSDAQV